MTDTNLISKFLHPGDRIRIGRNRACELVIPCPNLSGLHCAVEVKKTSESPRPSPFDGSGLTKCTVVDLSSNGTWLIKSEEDVARPKKLKKGVMADLCPGDCIMLLAPKHKLCMQHRFELQCNSAEAGSAEFVLVQLPWKGGDPSSMTVEKLPRKKPCGSDEADSKPDDLGNHMGAITKDSRSTRKRKYSYEPEDGGLEASKDSQNLKKSRLKATSSLSEHASINATEVGVATGGKWKLKPVGENNAPHEESTSCGGEEEKNHGTPDGKATLPIVESTVPEAPFLPVLPTKISLEQCPSCLKLFPVLELMAHAEVCMRECSRPNVDISEAGIDMSMRKDVTVSKSRESEAENIVSKPIATSTPNSSVPSMPTMEVSVEECPSCLKLFPLCELVEHSEMCRSRKKTVREEVKAREPMDADSSSRYNLESYSDLAAAIATSSTVWKMRENKPTSVSSKVGAATCVGTIAELEQCSYCLKDFPVPELIYHLKNCPDMDRNKVG